MKAPTKTIKGNKPAQKSTANVGFGKAGLAPGPVRPTVGLLDPAKPASYAGVDIRGVKAGSPKAQPMYTGQPSRPGKMTDQYGTGLVPNAKELGKGYQDQAAARHVNVSQKLNQG